METKQVSREWLREQYETRTVKEIAEELGVSKPTVYKALKDAGIPRKNPKDYVRLVVADE